MRRDTWIRCREKGSSRFGGINRLAVILLLLIAVVAAVVAYPFWETFRFRSEKTACIQAIKTAQDGLIIDYLTRMESESLEGARSTLDEVMPERPNICPANGTVYLVRGENGIYQPICGLHDSDLKERCRLNASHVKDLIDQAITIASLRRENLVAPLVVHLNGMDLTCVRVKEEEPLYRGTGTTLGYSGVVCYFGLDGEGEFSAKESKQGELCYLVYADEETCAIWRADEGWTGGAYED